MAHLEDEGAEPHAPTRPIRGPLFDGSAQGLPVRRGGLLSLDMMSWAAGGGNGVGRGWRRGADASLPKRGAGRLMTSALEECWAPETHFLSTSHPE